MRYSHIVEQGKALTEKYGIPASAAAICAGEGILVLRASMGDSAAACKGFIIQCHGVPAITVNADLTPELQQTVLYHEIAHYFLHILPGLMDSVHDMSVYDRVSESELEANMLAAELQLEDSRVLEALQECGDFFSAAAFLRVPAELMDFKVRLMQHKGYVLPDAPVLADGSYLARYPAL